MKFSCVKVLNEGQVFRAIKLKYLIKAQKSGSLQHYENNRGKVGVSKGNVKKIKNGFCFSSLSVAHISKTTGGWKIADFHSRLDAIVEKHEAGEFKTKDYEGLVGLIEIPESNFDETYKALNSGDTHKLMHKLTNTDYELGSMLEKFMSSSKVGNKEFTVSFYQTLSKFLFCVQKFGDQSIPLSEVYDSRSYHVGHIDTIKGQKVIDLNASQEKNVEVALKKLVECRKIFKSNFPKNKKGVPVMDPTNKRILSANGLTFIMLAAFYNNPTFTPHFASSRLLSKNSTFSKIKNDLLTANYENSVATAVKIFKLKNV